MTIYLYREFPPMYKKHNFNSFFNKTIWSHSLHSGQNIIYTLPRKGLTRFRIQSYSGASLLQFIIPFHPGRPHWGANLVTVGSGCPLLSLDLVALCWPPTLSVNLCSQTWCTCDEDWTVYQFWLVPSRLLAHTTRWGEVTPFLIPRWNCSHSWHLPLGSCAHHSTRYGCTPLSSANFRSHSPMGALQDKR